MPSVTCTLQCSGSVGSVWARNKPHSVQFLWRCHKSFRTKTEKSATPFANYAPYNAITVVASILKGVKTVLVHPCQLDDANKITATLTPYSNMPIQLILVSKCWAPKCIDVVNSWASQCLGCRLNSMTCMTDIPAKALMELLAEVPGIVLCGHEELAHC